MSYAGDHLPILQRRKSVGEITNLFESVLLYFFYCYNILYNSKNLFFTVQDNCCGSFFFIQSCIRKMHMIDKANLNNTKSPETTFCPCIRYSFYLKTVHISTQKNYTINAFENRKRESVILSFNEVQDQHILCSATEQSSERMFTNEKKFYTKNNVGQNYLEFSVFCDFLEHNLLIHIL